MATKDVLKHFEEKTFTLYHPWPHNQTQIREKEGGIERERACSLWHSWSPELQQENTGGGIGVMGRTERN